MSDTALATRQETAAVAAPEPRGFLIVESFKQAIEVAEYINKSALVPDAYRGRPADIVIAMQYGMELGLSPLQALWSIAIINGRPSVWGDALPGIVMSWGGDLEETDPEGVDVEKWEAACIVHRPGKLPKRATFSTGKARRAGLWGKKGPWESYPDRMLKMRARGFAVRDAYPDRLKGMILAEEAGDYQAPTPEPSEPRRVGESATPGAAAVKAAQTTPTSPSAPLAAKDASSPGPATSFTEKLAYAESFPSTLAPVPSPDQVERGVTIVDTKVIPDERGDLYEITTSRGVFHTRDKARYDEAATCEGTPTALAITWRPAKRKVAGKLEPMKALVMLALDDEEVASA